MRRALIILMVVIMSFVLFACQKAEPVKEDVEVTAPPEVKAEETKATKEEEETEPEDCFANKPTLRILVKEQAYDIAKDPSKIRIDRLTGYETEFFQIPITNGQQRFVLELASGADYDIVKVDTTWVAQVMNQGAILPLNDLMDKYGQNLYPRDGGKYAQLWSTTTGSDGLIYGIPHPTGTNVTETAYGLRFWGLVVPDDILDELSLTLPETIDDFTTFLETIKESKAVSPLSLRAAGALESDIMSGFGVAKMDWRNVDGTYVPMCKQDGIRDYVRYMEKLYADGLLDIDFPINTGQTINQKYTSGNAFVSNYAFWSIDGINNALAQAGYKGTTVYIPAPLRASATAPQIIVSNYGITWCEAIIKLAKNPEHAMNYINIRSADETYIETYIGYEDVTYTLDDDGNYWPILPLFTEEFNNASFFSGFVDGALEGKLWQARARKTEFMAISFEQMNENLEKEGLIVNDFSFYAINPTVIKYNAALSTLFSDFVVKAIVDGESTDEDFDAFLADWEAAGGTELQAEVNKLYGE